MRASVLALILGALVAPVGCGSDGDGGSAGTSGFDELYDQGLTRYVGMFEPANEPDPVEGGEDVRVRGAERSGC